MRKAKERIAGMERRHLVAACVVVVLLAAAVVATTIALVANTQKPATGGTVSLSGKMVCLPHKNTDGPQTLECAYGLQTDDNRYYGLQYSPFPSNVNVGDRVQVKGTLEPAGDSNYAITGTIKVDTISNP